MSDQCRSCGADVVFVPSATSGKSMILDAKPEKRIVRVRSDDQQVIYRATPGSAPAAARVVDTYVDHHATCPAAAQWKGRTR